jgi:methyl-accepting chemotaxis protein
MGFRQFFSNVAAIFRLTDLETTVTTEVFHRRTDVQDLLDKIVALRDENADVKSLRHSFEQALARIRVLETANLLPHPPTMNKTADLVRRTHDTIVAVAKKADQEILNLKVRVQGEFPNDIHVAFSRIEKLKDTVQDLAMEIGDLDERADSDSEALTSLGKAAKADIDSLKAIVKNLGDISAATEGILADKALDLKRQLTNLAEFVYTLAKKVTHKKTIVKDICNEIDKKRTKSGR